MTFENLSDWWMVVVLFLVIISAISRWVYFKVTRKELNTGDSNVLTNLRNQITRAVLANHHIVEIEKTEGRVAVRREIEAMVKTFVNDTESLTDLEKILINTLDVQAAVKYIEQELIRLNMLKSEDS